MEANKPLDHRYEVVKIMLEVGEIHLFRDIFLYIPKTIVAKDSKIGMTRWNELASDLTGFTLKRLDEIAGRIGVELEMITPLIVAEIAEQRAARLAKTSG